MAPSRSMGSDGSTDSPYRLERKETMSFISPDDNFICPGVPSIDSRGRSNFVTVEMKQLGSTVAIGSLQTRHSRYREYYGKFINKTKDPTPRVVLSMQDYRYHPRFDRPKFRLDQTLKHGCYPYPAIRTAIMVRMGTGLIDTNNLAKET